MGKRVYVATKYEVEYDSNAAFNWKKQEFKELLSNLNCYVMEDDEDGYSDIWKVSKEEFKRAIDFLKANKEKIYNYEENEYLTIGKDEIQFWCEEIYDAIMSIIEKSEFEECYQYALSNMEMFYKQADKKCNYMHFTAY